MGVKDVAIGSSVSLYARRTSLQSLARPDKGLTEGTNATEPTAAALQLIAAVSNLGHLIDAYA